MTDEEISQKIYKLQEKLVKEQFAYEKKIKKIKTEIFEIMKNCPHNKISFHSDPSGNNDSFMECSICGKEAKRL